MDHHWEQRSFNNLFPMADSLLDDKTETSIQCASCRHPSTRRLDPAPIYEQRPSIQRLGPTPIYEFWAGIVNSSIDGELFNNDWAANDSISTADCLEPWSLAIGGPIDGLSGCLFARSRSSSSMPKVDPIDNLPLLIDGMRLLDSCEIPKQITRSIISTTKAWIVRHPVMHSNAERRITCKIHSTPICSR